MLGLSWVSTAIGAVAAGALAFLLHTVDVDHIERKQATALAEQKTALENSCAKDKAITKGANDELQKNLSAVSAKLAAAKRVLPSTYIRVIATGQAQLAGVRGEHAGRDVIGASFDATASGLTSDWLSDYGAQCESIRQTLMTCERFIDDTWSKNGQ